MGKDDETSIYVVDEMKIEVASVHKSSKSLPSRCQRDEVSNPRHDVVCIPLSR